MTTYGSKTLSPSLNLQTNDGYYSTLFVDFQTNLIIFKIKRKYTFVIITPELLKSLLKRKIKFK